MNQPPHTVEAILLDLDGVLRFWQNSNKQIEESNRLPHGAIHDVAFASASLKPCISGLISDSQWRDNIANELSRRYPMSDAHNAVRIWSEPTGTLNTFALETLSTMCSGVKLVLATNATSRLQEDLIALGIHDLFFGIANSSDLGLIKPQIAFYRAALDIAGSQAEHVLYIDDTLDNIRAASEMGIRSHQYCTDEAMIAFLSETLTIGK